MTDKVGFWLVLDITWLICLVAFFLWLGGVI